MESIGARIKQIRKNENMTRNEFAAILKLTPNYVYFLETDRRNVQPTTIELMKINFGVNEEWLKTGEGEVYTDPLEGLEADDHVKDLTRKILQLPDYQQEAVMKIIDTLINE